ncbi:hypothetical protein BT96DRAFT_999166 [Gymnopus androsaceus JB14]|uniref:Uncharacterized protein n=1 Tax=Gymnopus androsaceus JB14 TaxID=1447944 RepID=A0A6A4H7J0_9AGAR|nr:hypothetical protein BT96DRAFT_999166 [Gymnopus androsaceus JB14]
METRRSAKNCTSADGMDSVANPPTGNKPEPSQSIPPAPLGPAKLSKRIIGKLPQNYVPPAEHSLDLDEDLPLVEESN